MPGEPGLQERQTGIGRLGVVLGLEEGDLAADPLVFPQLALPLVTLASERGRAIVSPLGVAFPVAFG